MAIQGTLSYIKYKSYMGNVTDIAYIARKAALEHVIPRHASAARISRLPRRRSAVGQDALAR